MKVRELIRQLQEADPTGEIEVVGWAGDIYFVERKHNYYDGYPNLLIHNEEERGKSYSIIGMNIGHPNGEDKIVLHEMDLDEVLLNDPDAIIINNTDRDYSKMIAAKRNRVIKIKESVERWSKRRKMPIIGWLEGNWNRYIRGPISRWWITYKRGY